MADDDRSDPDAPVFYVCPYCGQSVPALPDSVDDLMTCPTCGEAFSINDPPSEEDDDEAARLAMQQELDRERDLDGLRIRAFSTERRAMYRTRSYLILGVTGCVIGAYELADRLIRGSFSRAGQVSMVILIIGCGVGIDFFGKKIRQLQKDLQKPNLKEPDQPPDFEPLGDGSQTWKNLERMNSDDPDE